MLCRGPVKALLTPYAKAVAAMPGAIVLGGKVERIPGFAIGDRGVHESFDLFEHGYILRLVRVDVIQVNNQTNNQDKERERK